MVAALYALTKRSSFECEPDVELGYVKIVRFCLACQPLFVGIGCRRQKISFVKWP